MKKTISILIIIVSILLNVILLSVVLFTEKIQDKTPSAAKELQSRYPYLSQRILQDYDRDLLLNFVPLRTKLRELIEKEYKSDFTFYFEYLPTGSSIGVNEKIEFYSASLLKLPVIMAYYHNREKNNTKEDPMVIIKDEDIQTKFGDLWKKGVGSKIKLSEAVELALIESDNTAARIVGEKVEDSDYSFIYNGLDIIVKVDKTNTASFTTKAYSSILKSLFFSSLLTKDNSQHILDLLTKTKFNDKLPAGVPSNVPVAHKIGVYENLAVPVYSDCGIVYVPKRQYILCMASRSDEKKSAERMKTVSKIIYDYVTTVNVKN